MPEIRVIGNPIPGEFFMPPLWRHTDRPIKRLLAIGRLHQEKGYETLLKVFSKLEKKHPTWVLRIVGEGPLRELLEDSIAQLDLTGRVELPGYTHNIKSELLESELFVLSSHYEGFPNALLEAMATGVPSVTVNCPSGPREISEDGAAAILVPPDDEQALHDTLDIAMSDPQLRLNLSSAGRKSVIERFSLDKVLAQWERVFMESPSRS
jgi:glycosyltransferase involved in cell wall biosynthesis